MPPRSPWILAARLYSILLFVVGCCLAGCARHAPALIAVSEVAPARVELRDVLVINGEGFVASSDANVRFKGQVFRPGLHPRRVDLTTQGRAIDNENIELVVSTDMIDALCGATEDDGRSAHATFQGELEVAFVPRTPGAPPIVGRLPHLDLDVFRGFADGRPSAHDSSVLPWLGLEVEDLGASGLKVLSLAPDKPAAAAGIQLQDELRSWASVRLFSERDILPFPGQRRAEVTLLRKGLAGPVTVEVDVNGYAPLGADGWKFGLVLLSVLITAVLLSRTRVSQWLLWLVLSRESTARQAPRSRRVVAFVPFMAVSALFLGLANRQRLIPFELDLIWLAIVTSAALSVLGVHGAFRRGKWSLRRFFGILWRQLPVHLVFWLSVVVVVLERGSASLWELASVQTADPRSIGAFSSPSSFCVAWALFATVIGVWLGRYPSRVNTSPPTFQRLFRLSRGAGDLCCLLVAGVLVAVFGGGWGASLGIVDDVGLPEALSFQARFTLFYAGLVWLRGSIPAPPMQVVESWLWRIACSLVLLALVLLPVWWADVWPAWLRAGTQSFLMGISALILVGVPLALVALRRGIRNSGLGLNPWL